MLPTDLIKSHGEISDAAAAAFPDAHFIIVVKRGAADGTGDPNDPGNVEIDIQVQKGMTVVEADLRNMATAPQGLQIAPKNDELLLMHLPNGQTMTCITQPVWRWF